MDRFQQQHFFIIWELFAGTDYYKQIFTPWISWQKEFTVTIIAIFNLNVCVDVNTQSRKKWFELSYVLWTCLCVICSQATWTSLRHLESVAPTVRSNVKFCFWAESSWSEFKFWVFLFRASLCTAARVQASDSRDLWLNEKKTWIRETCCYDSVETGGGFRLQDSRLYLTRLSGCRGNQKPVLQPLSSRRGFSCRSSRVVWHHMWMISAEVQLLVVVSLWRRWAMRSVDFLESLLQFWWCRRVRH